MGESKMRKNNLIKKGVVVAVILLFISVSVIPSTGTTDVKQIVMPTTSGDTLYVGGNGTGNYTKIQDAIDNASDGDTVFVYDDSSPYYENLIVDKSITLKGENKETTVINGSDSEIVVNISSDNVILSGFTVLGNFIVEANYTIISGNIIKSHWECIQIGCFSGNFLHYNNTIMNNVFKSDGYICIMIFNTILNMISGNIISSGIVQGGGIWLHNSNDSVVSENIIKDSEISIILDICSNNTITKNTISNNDYGIYLYSSSSNTILKNNFLDNERDAFFITSFLNRWKQNYWNEPRVLPKLIFGVIEIGSIWLPWINIDWNPAQEPYDIGV